MAAGFQIQPAFRGQRHEVELKLFGRHQVYAGLAAVAVALENGLPIERALENLKTITPLRARMQPVRLKSGAWLLRDDFKAPLETMEACLKFFSQIPAERKYIIMGNISEVQGDPRLEYRRLAKLTAPLVSRLLFIGSNFKEFKSGFIEAGGSSQALVHCRDGVQQAISILQNELRDGDVALFKAQSNQRIGRAALALMGKKVRCRLQACYSRILDCEDCSMLEKGWPGLS